MKNYSKNLYLPNVLLIICMLLPITVNAQMFSIEEDRPERDRGIEMFTMIGLSWEVGEFTYTGNIVDESENLNFNDNILRFRFESPGLDLSLGFGGSLTGMNNTSYVNLSGRLFNNFGITRSESFMLGLPLQISSDLLQVQRNNSNAEFQQSSLTLGSGLSTIFKLGEKISFNLKATPNYGFSFSQGQLFGGNLFRMDGKGLLYIDDLFGSNALSIGYHFDYRSYKIDENSNNNDYDYDYTSHSITIGYAF